MWYTFIRKHYLKGTYSDEDLLILMRGGYLTEDEMHQLLKEKEELENKNSN